MCVEALRLIRIGRHFLLAIFFSFGYFLWLTSFLLGGILLGGIICFGCHHFF